MPLKKPHPLYSVWASMRTRCRNPKNRHWNDYGGRGITVCSRWDDFHAFVKDMGERPKNHSIDRIDNDGNYEPSNCRWATRKQQQMNRRVAVYVKIDGREYRAIDLAELAGVKTDTIVARAKRGLSYDKIMTKEPIRDLSGLSLGGAANGKRQKSKTHCPKGHAYTPDNLCASKEGYRHCKICHRDRERARRERLRNSAE